MSPPASAAAKSATWYRRGVIIFFLPSLIAFIAIGLAVWRIDADRLSEHRGILRGDVTREVGRLASNFKANVAGNINLVAGLAASFSVEPDMDQLRFSRLANSIFAMESQLTYLTAAPDLVITLAYPLETHQTAIGYDFRKSTSGIRSAEQARDTGKITLVGPRKTRKGYMSLIARYPVFTENARGGKTFWGIVSAVMDLDKVSADSGLQDPNLSVNLMLARANTPDTPFFGSNAVLQDEPVLLPIDLGYDKWIIAATPKAGWSQMPPDIAMTRFYAAAILTVIVGLFMAATLLLCQRQSYVAALQQREQQFERLSKRHDAALEASGIGIWEYDEAAGELIWDSRMRDLYDLQDANAPTTYSTWINALHPDDRITAEQAFSKAIIRAEAYTTEFRIITSDRKIRHIRAHGRVFRTANGTNRIVGANWNVTDDIELQSELRSAHQHAEDQNRQLEMATRSLSHQSSHDALTGLPNRRYFDTFVAGATDVGRVSFLHVDLDRFKDINDTYGHAAGDEVLAKAADRLKRLLEETEFVSRIGGDEFVIVSQGDSDRVRQLADKALASLCEPMSFGDTICQIGGSIGVATREAADEPLQQLLAHADTALYEAKRLGRNRIDYFTADLRATYQTLKRRMDDVNRAIGEGEFFPVFQPQFDASTHALIGVEVLARWQHPLQGVMAPDTFLDIAANLHKVAAIDAMVFEKALIQYMRWTAAGIRVPKMSVNVSAQRLMDDGFLKRLGEVRLAGGRLSLELLESISFEGDDRPLLDKIRQIKALGHEIEIDDFGTGHASIISLLEIAPNRLKIDRKLIAPILTHAPQRRLVTSMIEIGRSLGIEIIAEGVETLQHADLLCDLGCHGLQGYAFARPMTSDDFMTFVRDEGLRTSPQVRRA